MALWESLQESSRGLGLNIGGVYVFSLLLFQLYFCVTDLTFAICTNYLVRLFQLFKISPKTF